MSHRGNRETKKTQLKTILSSLLRTLKIERDYVRHLAPYYRNS